MQNSNGGDYFIVEPNIESHSIFKLTETEDAVINADIIVFLVAHKQFKNLKISNEKIVLDFCGVLLTFFNYLNLSICKYLYLF